jgi:isoleucyl-tRNA synthetase
MEQLLSLDHWAIAKAEKLQGELLLAYEHYEFHHIYQKVHNFCAVEMGSFYLDIIKDRQYTTQSDSVARRSAQTAIYHIVEAMTRWLAPILSFTAEEVWAHLPGQHNESVLLNTWHTFPALAGDTAGLGLDEWKLVMEVRDAVNKELEALRVAGGIGSGLDAEVVLYCGREIHDLLARLEDELRFVLITSAARIELIIETPPAEAMHYTLSSNDELWIAVAASAHSKCVRCWHHREDVGQSAEHPELCGRCIDNVAGNGEARRFA